jgi:dihydroceramide fatty acyl 2-hydroxylase
VRLALCDALGSSVVSGSTDRDPAPAEPSSLGASPRLFANPVLDKLSRTHHAMPLVIYLPIAAALLWFGHLRAPGPTILAAALAGYLLWTLVEYLGHRFLFHFAFRGRLGARVHFLIHGVHHAHPADKSRLVMPPLMSAPIILVAALVLRFGCGSEYSQPVLAGFILGYVGYDTIHYRLHHERPRTRLGKALQRWHLRHHFNDAANGFGVSAPWWDFVFGSVPKRRS